MSKSARPTDAEAFSAFVTLERWRAGLVTEPRSPRTGESWYVNGRIPHLPPGWSCDRFLRWCRERLRDGAVAVVVDGKLRRVRAVDLDDYVAAHPRKQPRLEIVVSTSDSSARDELLEELGGTLTTVSPVGKSDGGTRLEWTVPLS